MNDTVYSSHLKNNRQVFVRLFIFSLISGSLHIALFLQIEIPESKSIIKRAPVVSVKIVHKQAIEPEEATAEVISSQTETIETPASELPSTVRQSFEVPKELESKASVSEVIPVKSKETVSEPVSKIELLPEEVSTERITVDKPAVNQAEFIRNNLNLLSDVLLQTSNSQKPTEVFDPVLQRQLDKTRQEQSITKDHPIDLDLAVDDENPSGFGYRETVIDGRCWLVPEVDLFNQQDNRVFMINPNCDESASPLQNVINKLK